MAIQLVGKVYNPIPPKDLKPLWAALASGDQQLIEEEFTKVRDLVPLPVKQDKEDQ